MFWEFVELLGAYETESVSQQTLDDGKRILSKAQVVGMCSVGKKASIVRHDLVSATETEGQTLGGTANVVG